MTRLYYLMKRLLVVLTLLISCLSGNAQVVTTSPSIVQQSSSPIVITFHADSGNGGLKGLPASTAVYAHTGVILEGSDQWSYASSWGNNSAKYKMTYVSPNTYTLTIPSIASYYGVPDDKKVSKLAFVFRNSNGSAEGKTADGGDIFVDVVNDGLYVKLTADIAPGLLSQPTDVNFKINSTQNATLKLYRESRWSTPIVTQENTSELNTTYGINLVGVNEIIATATVGNTTVADTLIYTLVGASKAIPYPGGVPHQGAVTNDDGTVIFCLGAPQKSSVMIVGAWNNYFLDPEQVMNYQDYNGFRYFWVTLSGLNTGKQYPYYYIVDNKIKVGDPYARLVLDPWNDKYISQSVFPDMIPYPNDKVENVPLAVYCSSPSSYKWEATNFKGVDKTRLVIYELLIRDFNGNEGKADGNGTIKGVIDKLDYIKSLGVNAIEFLPIMEFNGNNSWGYNTNFYFAPDKAYGTPDDYRLLFDEIHKRGMAVILDIVFNQTDGLHPWYQMYPISSNPFYNGAAPHAYSVLNDWNQDNALVQQQFKDALKYWLTEYHVDGFRFDLVKGLGSNASYDATYNSTTNTFTGVTDDKTNRYNSSRVVRMKELHDAMREVKPDAYFINENLAGAVEENEMADDGEINWANINDACCQFAMGYPSDSNMNRFYAPQDSRTWGSTVSYAESHDEERMAYKCGMYGVSGVKGNTAMTMRRLGSVAAIMLMTPGSHMIWQFQEFGADQTTKNSDGGNNTDPKKVIWSYLDNADREGLKDTYSLLNALRNDNPEMFAQDVTTSLQCNTVNWSAGRFISLKSGNKMIFLAVNPNTSGQSTLTIPGMPTNVEYQLLLSSYNVTPVLQGNKVTLPAGAFAIYGTKDIAQVNDIVTDDSSVNIYVVNGKIVVDGKYDNVEIFDLSGRKYAADSQLNQGIYIVKVDDKIEKILI